MTTPPPISQPTPQPKKRGCLRAFLVLLGIFVVLMVIGLIATPKPSNTSVAAIQTASPSADSTAVASPTPTPTPEGTSPAASDDMKKMGEDFRLGDFTYKITNAFAVGGIERAFQQPLRAADGAAFVIVEYSIRNDGKASDNMWVNGLKLQDSQGREFGSSSEVKMEIEMRSKRNDMFVKQLQPGVTRQLKEGFEVPRDALNQPLVLLMSERGIFSTGQAKVDLVVTKRTMTKDKKR